MAAVRGLVRNLRGGQQCYSKPFGITLDSLLSIHGIHLVRIWMDGVVNVFGPFRHNLVGLAALQVKEPASGCLFQYFLGRHDQGNQNRVCDCRRWR